MGDLNPEYSLNLYRCFRLFHAELRGFLACNNIIFNVKMVQELRNLRIFFSITATTPAFIVLAFIPIVYCTWTVLMLNGKSDIENLAFIVFITCWNNVVCWTSGQGFHDWMANFVVGNDGKWILMERYNLGGTWMRQKVIKLIFVSWFM